MSAGVSTAVGGHSGCKDKNNESSVGQFDISDERSVDEMCQVLTAHGFQPIFKDLPPSRGWIYKPCHTKLMPFDLSLQIDKE